MSTFQKDKNIIKEVLLEKRVKQAWLVEQFRKSYNMVDSYIYNIKQPRLVLLFEMPKFEVKQKEII